MLKTEVITKPATLPATRRAMIVDVNVSGIVRSFMPEGIDETTIIKPRFVQMTHESARAAVGAGVTAKSLYAGLVYLTLAYAHGQGKVTDLTKGAPAFVNTALSASAACFKYGSGTVKFADLTTAIEAATNAMLALAAPAKATKAAPKVVAAPVTIDATATEEKPTIDANGRALVHSLAYGHEAHEDALRSADTNRTNATLIDAAIQRQADKARGEMMRTMEPEIASMFNALASVDNGKAETLLRALAARLGFTLTSLELKNAA